MMQEEILERDVSGAAAEGAGDGTESLRAISPILPTSIKQGTESKSYSIRIVLSGTYTWTLSTKSKWIQLSAVEGQGTATVNCTVAAFSDSDAWRVGEIVFVYTSPSETKKVTIPVTQSAIVWPVGGSQYMAGEKRTAEDRGNGTYPAKGWVVIGRGAISSFYGARFTSLISKFNRHWAIDIDVDNDNTTTKAFAALSGKVIKTGTNETNGNYVYLEHTVTNKDNTTVTLYTRYLHLKEIDTSVKEGNSIKAGAPIGTVGKTGSAGKDVHLHFAVLKRLSSSAAVAYYLNPVAYYHGSDDRGVKSGNALQEHANNPMFILNGEQWAVNPSFDPFYKSFQSTSDIFFEKFLSAKRSGKRIATASTSI